MEEKLLKLIKLNDKEKLAKYLYDNESIIDWKKIAIPNPSNSCENFILGRIYLMGLGVKKDYQKAFYYYELSAKQNHPGAQNNLGYMYENGLGVKKDYQKSLYYYELSAEQENSIAQYNLGLLYKNGLGVEKDYQKALYYFGLSAEKDHSNAKEKFQEILKNHPDIVREIYQKNFELDGKNRELEKKIEKMEEEMECIPGYGKIYFNARKHFEDHK